MNGEFTNSKCINCNNEMTNLVQEALIVCLNCGYQDVLLAEQNRPIMLYDKKDGIHYSYKRINHFREWISQIQGKESTDIPNEVFEKILNELKKEKITDTTKLTPKFMRTILKKLRTHKYYEHTAYIINRINGIPPPQFSPELEQNLSNMFMQTQPLFIKYAPANRLNFISYSYILHKFFLILDMPEYLALFPLLKSRQKIAQNEEVFKKICKELKWTWIPSI
jgi:DNA-directed RNA polymerase subunit RPC12/RpoP